MFDRLLAAVDRIFQALIATLFFAIVVIGGLQVFNRFVLNQSLSWSEEFMVYANVWMVFLFPHRNEPVREKAAPPRAVRAGAPH
jgi:TRAP-type C4-dicarboxylate transport system permease small subunit